MRRHNSIHHAADSAQHLHWAVEARMIMLAQVKEESKKLKEQWDQPRIDRYAALLVR
jgi:hypothetical protein